MTALYKRLMAVQTETRSAVVVVHHDAKGKAGDRDKRDRGSGSGVMGRFCDSRILLTPHKDDPENWVCVDMMYRYLPPQKGITVKMEDGRFIEVADVACEPETSKAAVSTMPETQAIRDACEQAKRIILGSEKPMTKTEVKDAISKSKGGTGALSRAKALTEMVATLEVMAADGEAGFEF
jgi:RecA-family ATPase